jgi:hypothetical protein
MNLNVDNLADSPLAIDVGRVEVRDLLNVSVHHQAVAVGFERQVVNERLREAKERWDARS